MWDFVVDKVALEQVFSEYFGFPCQLSFHRLLQIHHHLLSAAGTIGQLVTDLQVDSVSLHHKKERKKRKKNTLVLGEFPVLFPSFDSM
jgi:hypothetical protein